jgi:methyl-accepting chemotaxis protein
MEEGVTNAALQETEQTFDQTLRALLDGGTAPYLSDTTVTLPLTRDPQIRSALNRVSLTWSGFRALLDKLQQTPHDDPSFSVTLQSIEEKSSTLAAQADQVVRLYEADSVSKVNRLRAIQTGFFVCALILLGAGVWLTRHSALQPLRQLARAANRLGENDLETAVQVKGPEEMRTLAQAFESMRLSLRASRQELVASNAQLSRLDDRPGGGVSRRGAGRSRAGTSVQNARNDWQSHARGAPRHQPPDG